MAQLMRPGQLRRRGGVDVDDPCFRVGASPCMRAIGTGGDVEGQHEAGGDGDHLGLTLPPAPAPKAALKPSIFRIPAGPDGSQQAAQ